MNGHTHTLNAVVVADAPVGDLQPFRDLLQRADLVIAADGGARHVLALKMIPQVAIGDFDSLDVRSFAQLEQAGVEIRRHPVHKEETDLELALLLAVEQGSTCIHVLAALGGRPDQHLANLQLLTHPAFANVDVRLLHERWEAFAIRRSASIYGTPGDIVSLLPMTEVVTGIITTGLYYPLQNEALRLGPARGVSNVLVSSQADVTIERGILLCMHENARGWRLEAGTSTGLMNQAPTNVER
jgi:thiamine pyrophosphokinase